MKRAQGFSLIELVIVIVILGLLAATALPRFLNVTEDAEDATVEGVAGGFAAAVGLVRAAWELDGRPRTNDNGSNTSVVVDNTTIWVDGNTGYPVGLSAAHDVAMDAAACLAVMDSILQSPPRATTATDDDSIDNNRYLVRSLDDDGNGDLCVYYLIATLNKSSLPAAGDFNNDGVGNSFTYQPRTGRVIIFNQNRQ
ncbi:type II secretion system protein [Gallaecimonas sp. GXIMD4217]|uniref:type II secretion system protein n=1 Tax=Gallaecimonas sp. GXIMD4217 TaxID=3131927 RepID=UPI00311B2B97